MPNVINAPLSELRGSDAWEGTTEPVISFVCDDGKIFGFLFAHFVAAQYVSEPRHCLLLRWAAGVIQISGPKAVELYREFAKHKATWIQADGVDIVSVKLRPKEPAKEEEKK